MATFRGNDGVVKLGANAVAEVKNWQITENATTMDDSELSDEWDTHLAGSKNWTGSLTCNWDESDTNGQATLRAGVSVTLGVYGSGDGSGKYYYSGVATVTSVSRQGSRNNVVEASFSFTGNGALTPAVVES